MTERNYSEEYKKEVTEYAQRLLEKNLPVIFDLTHLSLLVGMEKKEMAYIIFGENRKNYKLVQIPKKSGGHRKISIPCTTLKFIQKWILKNILNKMEVSNFATGFEKNKSIKNNAQIHLNQKCIINIDIADFFPSIDMKKVYKIFRKAGYSKSVSYCLALICTNDNKLPQGAPTSPKLANIYCKQLDYRINGLCQKYHARYSRYADDITISGNKTIKNCLKIVKDIIEEEGFHLNNKKTRIQKNGQRQEVTGLNLNSGKVTIPRKYKRELKQEIYYCKKYGVENHLEHINIKKAFYKEHLYGKAYFINMIEPEVAKKILEELDSIEWSY